MPEVQHERFFFNIWTGFVAHYSLRTLTFQADKLLAITGIVQVFGRIMHDKFVAGLWLSHLMESLLWYIRNNTVTDRPKYRAPTWSWASCEGYIIHAEAFAASPWTVARALSVSCETLTGGAFGMVASASLTLQAFCLKMRFHEGEWISHHDRFNVLRIIVRLDTNEGVVGLEEICAAIIRTTAYRLVDTTENPASSKKILGVGSNLNFGKKGKILLAAQGIMLVPVAPPPLSTLDKQSSTSTEAILTPRREGKYRRIGYFALEDRKSGTLTPRWVPTRCSIFRESVITERHNTPEDSSTFPFDGQQEFLNTLEIV